jgi:hypothetical protein
MNSQAMGYKKNAWKKEIIATILIFILETKFFCAMEAIIVIKLFFLLLE